MPKEMTCGEYLRQNREELARRRAAQKDRQQQSRRKKERGKTL